MSTHGKDKIILAVNAGSSSVKISVYKASQHSEPEQLAEASVSGLTSSPATFTYTRGEKSVSKNDKIELKPEHQQHQSQQDDHNSSTDSETDKTKTTTTTTTTTEEKQESIQTLAFRHILTTLTTDSALPQLSRKQDISLVAHRIVHGGNYTSSQVITSTTYHHLETLNDLAPLHNAKGLEIIHACMKHLLPDATNIACFDSQFHSSIPKHIYTYPIDQAVAEKNGLRKYGFHGLSYSFITRSVARFLGKAVEGTSIIALHLGSGASACAIKGGKSRDTSMGLTPLAGLPGATRSGSIDPSLVFHYASNVGKLSPHSTSSLHISRAEEILNQESGWKALTGTTDFGEIAAAAAATTTTRPQTSPTNPSGRDQQHNQQKHKLAFDLLTDRISAFIGSYYVSLHGQVDALVFAGGIGEKSADLRRAVVEQVACLGFVMDGDKNKAGLEDVVCDITGGGGKGLKVLVCKTDEQFEMARDCAEDEELWK